MSVEEMLRELLQVEREQLEELRRLRADLRQTRVGRPDSAEVALVRSINATMGAKAFTCAELVGVATEGLRTALDRFGKLDARRLGKIMQRIEGQDVEGIKIARIGQGNAGAIWCLKVD